MRLRHPNVSILTQVLKFVHDVHGNKVYFCAASHYGKIINFIFLSLTLELNNHLRLFIMISGVLLLTFLEKVVSITYTLVIISLDTLRFFLSKLSQKLIQWLLSLRLLLKETLITTQVFTNRPGR